MSRIDWLILKRLLGRIGLTVLLAFGMVVLVESLDTWRFQHMSAVGGPLLGIVAMVASASLWTLNTLPVTLLLGSIIGLLDLQARRELTVIRASGVSVWRTLRAPLIAILALGVTVSVVGDTAVVTLMRALSLNLPQAGASGALWLEQQAGDRTYVMFAVHPLADGTILRDVTVFLPAELGGPRLRAPVAELKQGFWDLPEAVRLDADEPARIVNNIQLPTRSTPGDMQAQLSTPTQLTIFELLAIESMRVADPSLRSGVQMRLLRLLAMPLALAGSLVIAFAFTAGYRRTNKYGGTVLYGIVLGFVVYVVTETASMAGAAGIVQPAFAAFAPALVAMIVGTTVLLYKEDGRY
jgi:lipopolysaccharide export system permease protein